MFLQRLMRASICERQKEVLYGFGIGVSLVAGLEVSLSSLLFSVGLVFLLMGWTSVELLGSFYSGLGLPLYFLPIVPM